jgi:hypothetical protein
MVTMTVTPSESTVFPATAEVAVASLTDQASAEKAKGAQYGLSDENASAFNRSEASGAIVDEFDSRLKAPPLEVKGRE